MGISVHMDIRGKTILIVGGGKVSLRKAQVFLREQAIVHIVAPQICDELTTLPCIIHKRNYERTDITNVFLVMAATDDALVNLQIIQDAKEKGILCMSCNKEHAADVQSLCYDDTGIIHFAISTKKSYPALNRIMLKDTKAYIEKQYTKRLELLTQVREHILSNTQIMNKKELLCFFANAQMHLVQFFLETIHKGKCCILAFHGVKIKESTQEIYDFLALLKKQLPAYGLGFGYLSNNVVNTLNTEQNNIFSISYVMEILSYFSIQVYVYPMLFQEGRFYDTLCTYRRDGTYICKPPFVSLQDIRELITLCVSRYKETKHIICMYHSSKTGKFASMLTQLKEEYRDVLFLHEAQQDSVHLNYQDEDIVIIPLYMLKGLHMQELNCESLLIKKLQKQQCNIEYQKIACFLNKDLQMLFIHKIMKEIQA